MPYQPQISVNSTTKHSEQCSVWKLVRKEAGLRAQHRTPCENTLRLHNWRSHSFSQNSSSSAEPTHNTQESTHTFSGEWKTEPTKYNGFGRLIFTLHDVRNRSVQFATVRKSRVCLLWHYVQKVYCYMLIHEKIHCQNCLLSILSLLKLLQIHFRHLSIFTDKWHIYIYLCMALWTELNNAYIFLLLYFFTAVLHQVSSIHLTGSII